MNLLIALLVLATAVIELLRDLSANMPDSDPSWRNSLRTRSLIQPASEHWRVQPVRPYCKRISHPR